MSRPALPLALAAACIGGILGALARYGATELFPAKGGFPWSTFAINVFGSALLAALPLVSAIRRRPWLAVGIGTGALGGFTTMSTASVETVLLVESDQTATAVLYVLGTLAAALAATHLVARAAPAGSRAELEAEGADE